MPLAPGSRLGPYEIVAPIGAGGMGEVYRAHDPRLGRDVAVKIMPAGMVDADRQTRFEQEARAAAALNHPNILAVFDVGQHDGQPYIVSELLNGESLHTKLQDGAMPLRQAVACAIQVARGLAAAHVRGIVHRDLKPGNIFLTTDGHAKILDFGLAKLAAAPSTTAGSASIAITTPVGTAPGLVFGTVGYMAPEQVRAQTVDHRADIFAFGVVLYEMVTGTRAFSRETPPETMTAILKEDVAEQPLTSRQVPPALTRIIRRCTDKDPNARFQSALDLAFALDAMDTASTSGPLPAAPAHRGASREWLAWAVAAAAIVAAIAALAMRRPPTAPTAPLIRLSATPPDGWSTRPRAMARPRPISISPDGRKVAVLAARPGEPPQIWIRDIDAVEMHQLDGTAGAAGTMIWSPDSRTIAFNAQGGLRRVSLSGGQSEQICSCVPIGGFWHGDYLIIGSGNKPIQRMTIGGGTTPITHFEGSDNTHGVPVPIDDKYFLFGSIDATGRHINSATFDGREQHRIEGAEANTFYYVDGYVVHEQAGAIVAQRLNQTRTALEGPVVTLVDHVYVPEIDAGRWPIFHVSGNVLAYQTGPPDSLHDLIWVDRGGRTLETIPGQGVYSNVELSPDGSQAALAVIDAGARTRDIWTFSVARPALSRLTFDQTEERSMAWSPDGRQIYFNSGRNRVFDLFRKNANGVGPIVEVFKDGKSKDANAVSPDGRWLVYRVTADDGSNDLWMKPLDVTGAPKPLIVGRFDDNYARFTPDGQWMAYVSDESGQHEVYVVSFPEPTLRTRVTTSGGDFPRWRGDGRELYYMTADSTVMAVSITPGKGELNVGRPEALFRANVPSQPGQSFAVSPDGKRFLLIHDTTPPPPPVTILLNWQQLLTAK